VGSACRVSTYPSPVTVEGGGPGPTVGKQVQVRLHVKEIRVRWTASYGAPEVTPPPNAAEVYITHKSERMAYKRLALPNIRRLHSCHGTGACSDRLPSRRFELKLDSNGEGGLFCMGEVAPLRGSRVTV
jgi:hypothetical protein